MQKKNLKVNLHTHSSFCDGTNTPEELVLAAIEKGFDVLGFSGHSYMAYDDSYCMSREGTLRYREEIHRLAAKYADSITVLCGIEQDYYSDEPTAGYDYVIGSVHAFYKEKNGIGRYICVDESPEILRDAIRDIYEGDPYGLAEDYFETVSRVTEKTHCDIIGHFDLLTKFNEEEHFFDTGHPRYVAAADRALQALLSDGAVFEINTGAMAKGYRTAPYPSGTILRKIARAGGRITIASDSHSAETLDFAFDEAAALAGESGFDSQWFINKDKIWVQQLL